MGTSLAVGLLSAVAVVGCDGQLGPESFAARVARARETASRLRGERAKKAAWRARVLPPGTRLISITPLPADGHPYIAGSISAEVFARLARRRTIDRSPMRIAKLRPLLRAYERLAFATYRLWSKRAGVNAVFSPWGVAEGLGLAALDGSAKAERHALAALMPGVAVPRYHELAGGLHRRLHRARPLRLSLLLSRLWRAPAKALPAPVKRTLAGRHYESDDASLPSSRGRARLRVVNRWAARQSGDLVVDLVGTQRLDDRGVVTSVPVVVGFWKGGGFPLDATRRAPFYLEGDAAHPLAVAMMRRKWDEARYAHIVEAGLEVVALPFAGEGMSLLLLIPERRRGALGALEARLSQGFSRWTSRLVRKPVDLSLPRFSVFGRLARSHLPGAIRAATRGLAGLVQGTRVDIDEHGVNATFGSAPDKGWDSDLEYVRVRVDRPFAFAIRDDASGALLMLGRIGRPVARTRHLLPPPPPPPCPYDARYPLTKEEICRLLHHPYTVVDRLRASGRFQAPAGTTAP